MSTSARDLDFLIVRRISSGEERALEELWTRLSPAVFRYISALVSDRQLAEEVLQDTFVAVWKGAGSFQERSSVRTWLFGIARRQAISALRRRRLPTGGEVPEELPETGLGPEGLLLRHDRRVELARCVESLGLAQREALILVFYQGFSYKEAAEVQGVSVGTVKSRVNRAKRALHERLREPIAGSKEKRESE